ncbi:MAG TPA: 1,4-alpha-glucan branching enzyme, partial [Acholeplasma sp.]|nr:1,4-alpha-glucan branching enzyme [Acholeplasma sp.]
NNKELDWHLLVEYEAHRKAARFFRDLARVYNYHPALFELDHDPKGFKWLILDHYDSSVFSYARFSKNETLVIILNMTPNYYESYEIGVPLKGYYEEIFNSDKGVYGGSDQYNGLPLKTVNEPRNNEEQHIKVKVGSLAAIILKYKKDLK